MTPKHETLLLIAWLTIALLLGALTWRVQAATGPMAVDLLGADWVAALRSEPLTALMRTLHKLQGKVVAAAILIWAVVLLRRRQFRALTLLFGMVPLGMLANSGLKLLVERPRPLLVAAVGSHGSSYPSGHTAAITVFCGYLVVLAFRFSSKLAWRFAASAAALCVVALVAFSRVYLGVHHATDVGAAVLLGLVWIGLCLSGAQALTRAGRPTVP